MEDSGTESDFSDSTGSSSSENSTSNESSSFDTGAELAKINNVTFRLPKDICENAIIFKEFFSISTWRELPDNFQAFLKNKFLPTFPENNEVEQEKTLQMLFNNELNWFTFSPLLSFYKNLEEGTYRPDISKLKRSIERSRRREQRFKECERISKLSKTLLLSRERLLRAAYSVPPGNAIPVDHVFNSTPKISQRIAASRARKRFIEEIQHIRKAIDLSDSSDEENPVNSSSKNCLEQNDALVNNELKIIGTMARDENVRYASNDMINLNDINLREFLLLHKRRKLEEPDRPEFETNDIRLRDVHARTQISGNLKKAFSAKQNAKKRRGKAKPSNDTDNVRTQRDKNFVEDLVSVQKEEDLVSVVNSPKSAVLKSENIEAECPNTVATVHTTADSDEHIKKRQAPQTVSTKAVKKVILTVNGSVVPEQPVESEKVTRLFEEDSINERTRNVVNLPSYRGKVKAATLSDLEGIDMMHLPVDLDETGDVGILTDTKPTKENTVTELMQETHVCFFSLIRDIFCSTPNHRMKLNDLQTKISTWLSNPITALNDWYNQADNWLELISSAVQFLVGEFSNQPEDFVPYLEFKLQLNIYQWIGAGRDSDQHLLQLCNYWLLRRTETCNSKSSQKSEMIARKSLDADEISSNERPVSPPPPRCPTSWIVQPYTADEIVEFRQQEKQRFEHPHRAFTYRMHAYESVVGPVKGIYTQIFALTKARGHNMLTADRPNFVTILTLVRDATARLPNGEGTRADICELLKSSQYINPQAQDSILQTIVSGALDRMHTEHDPCVRYDPKRKIWIYLHRNRSEDEFEKLHQQFQGVGKHKKTMNRKIKQKIVKLSSAESASSAPALLISPISNVLSNTPPALSTITQSTALPTNTLKNNITPPPLKISPSRCQMKPELVPIKQPISIIEKSEKRETDLVVNMPVILQKVPSVPVLVVDEKITKSASKKAPIANQPLLFKGSKASVPPILQSNPVPTVSIGNTDKQCQSILATSPVGQSILHSSTQILMNSKKITKPLLVSQNASALVSQSASTTHGYVIPVNINNTSLKTVSPISPTLVTTANISPKIIKTVQPPALTNTVTAKQTLPQQGNKNYMRVASATAQAGKSLISPHVAATNISLQQQQQKLLGNILGIPTQPKIATVAQTNSNMNRSLQKTTLNSFVTKVQSPIVQKQIIQNIISSNMNKANVQRGNFNIPSHTIVLPTGQSTSQRQVIQGKPVVMTTQQQNIQKIIVSSANGSMPTSNMTSTPTGNLATHTIGSSLMNPQIIQIQQGGQISEGKVQQVTATCLTQHQQQNILQSIKQHQKGQQMVSSNQHSLVIKQQSLNQLSKQNSQAKQTASSKTVASFLNANTIDSSNAGASSSILHTKNILNSQNTAKQLTINPQQQTITRVIKSVTPLMHPQVITTVSGVRTQEGNAVVAKVLTNNSGQIISLESLLQKQGVTTGSTLRVTGTKSNQTNLIQLATAGSQLSQYAVVSQARNLISVATSQRSITTQANSVVTTLATNATSKVNDQKILTAVSPTTSQSQVQTVPKIISANQMSSMTTPQLINAKLLNKTAASGIRMVNAANLNIAHIRGKPVIIASKPTSITGHQSGQNVIIQNPINSANIVIGGQTLKVQGNVTSVLGQPTTSQHQTVVLGNQIIKVQQTSLKTNAMTTTTNISSSISSNTNTNNSNLTLPSTSPNTVVVNSNTNLNQLGAKAVVLGSTGQSIRLSSPTHVSVQAACNSTQNQTMLLGAAVKGTAMKSTSNGQHRVVLAVQGGGQIILPPNFHGSAINLKGLQGLKVVSIAQQGKGKQLSKQT